jgi:hypothetical protein
MTIQNPDGPDFGCSLYLDKYVPELWYSNDSSIWLPEPKKCGNQTVPIFECSYFKSLLYFSILTDCWYCLTNTMHIGNILYSLCLEGTQTQILSQCFVIVREKPLSVYSYHLNTVPIWNLDAQFASGCRMVRYSNGLGHSKTGQISGFN